MIVKTVGRGQDNNIVIHDENVSRVHLQLVQDDNGNVSVVDLGSTNGTFVNGSRISSETKLKPGDLLRIGDTELPWQSYFHKPQAPIPPKTPNRKWIWLAIMGGVLLIMIVVGIVIVNAKNNEKEAEKERVEMAQKDKLIEIKENKNRDLKDRKRKAELDAEAEKIKRAEEGRRFAAEQRQAEKNKQDAVDKAKVAKKEADSSTLQREGAIIGLTEEILKRQSAEEDAKKATSAAQKSDSIAKVKEDESKLTNEFYKELNKAQSENRLKEICTELGIEKVKTNTERYNQIVIKFDSAKDNSSKRKIINTIKNTQKKTLFGRKKSNNSEEENKK